jgi:hypothetical protein
MISWQGRDYALRVLIHLPQAYFLGQTALSITLDVWYHWPQAEMPLTTLKTVSLAVFEP